MPAIIQAFFDPVTATVTYVVHEDAGRRISIWCWD